MEFEIKKRLLTTDEKYRRAIFFYTYEMDDFEVEFEDEEFDEYDQPQVKIKENLDKLDNKTLQFINEFVNKEIYDETIDLKCLKCFYEETDVDWEMVEESWDGNAFPKMYCPKCGKPHFVPLDIWKKKNKYRK